MEFQWLQTITPPAPPPAPPGGLHIVPGMFTMHVDRLAAAHTAVAAHTAAAVHRRRRRSRQGSSRSSTGRIRLRTSSSGAARRGRRPPPSSRRSRSIAGCGRSTRITPRRTARSTRPSPATTPRSAGRTRRTAGSSRRRSRTPSTRCRTPIACRWTRRRGSRRSRPCCCARAGPARHRFARSEVLHGAPDAQGAARLRRRAAERPAHAHSRAVGQHDPLRGSRARRLQRRAVHPRPVAGRPRRAVRGRERGNARRHQPGGRLHPDLRGERRIHRLPVSASQGRGHRGDRRARPPGAGRHDPQAAGACRPDAAPARGGAAAAGSSRRRAPAPAAPDPSAAEPAAPDAAAPDSAASVADNLPREITLRNPTGVEVTLGNVQAHALQKSPVTGHVESVYAATPDGTWPRRSRPAPRRQIQLAIQGEKPLYNAWDVSLIDCHVTTTADLVLGSIFDAATAGVRGWQVASIARRCSSSTSCRRTTRRRSATSSRSRSKCGARDRRSPRKCGSPAGRLGVVLLSRTVADFVTDRPSADRLSNTASARSG